MFLFLLLILILLAATGVLWFVVKVALAVALGIFLAVLAITAFIAWRVRRAFRRAAAQSPQVNGGTRRVRTIRTGTSEVTILRPEQDPERSIDEGVDGPG